VQLINVPLSQLASSPRNVRKMVLSDISELAASIQAHGLLQNLTVIDHGEQYQVVAGGMRLRALQDLAKRNLIAPDYLVPCNVVAADDAHEASLTENVTRSAMHPADEFDAFNRLVEDGASVGEVATRFGKTERYVQQRMRMALISPTVLKDYREGNATLEQMMALAMTDDQALQLRVWKAARGQWEREPNRLRDAITDKECSVASGIGKFVGIEAYEKAGGTVRRDLFGNEEDSFLVDTELVQRLALEKLERTAERVRKEGWAWVEVRTRFDWSERSRFGEVRCTYKGSKKVYADEAKQHAGAVVCLGHNGQADVERGLVRPGDRKSAAKAAKGDIKGGHKSPADRKPGDLSFASVQRLQAEASQIAALAIAGNPAIALGLLAAELADDVFYQGYNGPRTWVHVTREHTGRIPAAIRNQADSAPAALKLAEMEKAWRERLPKKRTELRAWILAQDFPTIQQLLAFLVARETEVIDFSAGAKESVVDLVAAAGVDLSAEWKPSSEWLGTVPKSTVLAMAQEAGADKLALAKLVKLPKAAFAESAVELFPAGWLPKPLRPAKPAIPKKAHGKKKAKPKNIASKARTAKAKPFPWSIAE